MMTHQKILQENMVVILINTTVELLWDKNNCYNNGAYYERLLPRYSWNGLSDKAFLDYTLSKIFTSNIHSILELSSGTGRATSILRQYTNHIDAVELNKAMIERALSYSGPENIINDDINIFLQNKPLENYDLIFSFWGPYPNVMATNSMINKISRDSHGLFFHAHRGCVEQKIIRKMLNVFVDKSYDPEKDISKKEELFSELLGYYASRNIIGYDVEEIRGTANYSSIDCAVESFLNLHLAGVLSKKNYFAANDSLYEILSHHTDDSGQIIVDSGMKIFRFKKL